MGDKTEPVREPAQPGEGQGDQPNSGSNPTPRPQNPFSLEPVSKGLKLPQPRQ